VKLQSRTTELERVLAGPLWYLNRAGLTGQIAPLLRKLEDRTQVLVFNETWWLEAFVQSAGLPLGPVLLEAADWRAREEFLRAAADQGALELLLNHTPQRAGSAYRLGRAMLEVQLHKTSTACL
jgi:hypothetical protein